MGSIGDNRLKFGKMSRKDLLCTKMPKKVDVENLITGALFSCKICLYYIREMIDVRFMERSQRRGSIE